MALLASATYDSNMTTFIINSTGCNLKINHASISSTPSSYTTIVWLCLVSTKDKLEPRRSCLTFWAEHPLHSFCVVGNYIDNVTLNTQRRFGYVSKRDVQYGVAHSDVLIRDCSTTEIHAPSGHLSPRFLQGYFGPPSSQKKSFLLHGSQSSFPRRALIGEWSCCMRRLWRWLH